MKEVGGEVFSVDLNQLIALNTIREDEMDDFFEMIDEYYDDYGGDY